MANLSRIIRLTWCFYRNYCLASLTISLVFAFALWRLGFGNHVFFCLFWFKMITLGLIFYFINSYKKKEFYYFQNLGLSKQWLWISTLSFDFLILIFLLIVSGTI